MPLLPLREMHARHRGLTKAVAAYYFEAACVCLSRHHEPPRPGVVQDDSTSTSADLEWDPPDAVTVGAWANRTDTTEAGAYSIVLAAAELTLGMVAVRRAETGTGADYYVGPPGAGVEDLEDCYRLEISGTDSADSRELMKRLSAKIAQTQRGNSSLPALAGVVGYPQCMVLLRHVA
jgi:hypothetical protein